jgi:hypothetical protein
MADSPINFDISQILEGISKVKLRGGVVGKVSVVLISTSICIAIIALKSEKMWISVFGMSLIFVFCSVFLWRLVSFADRNPQAALLEGAEFLVHQQMQLGMKSMPALPPSIPVAPPGSEQIAGQDMSSALLPDSQGTSPDNSPD